MRATLLAVGSLLLMEQPHRLPMRIPTITPTFASADACGPGYFCTNYRGRRVWAKLLRAAALARRSMVSVLACKMSSSSKGRPAIQSTPGFAAPGTTSWSMSPVARAAGSDRKIQKAISGLCLAW